MEITDEKLPPFASSESSGVQIILPGPNRTISDAAAQIAKLMAGFDYFRRGSEVVRITSTPHRTLLEPIGAQLFRSEAEQLGELVRGREPRGKSEGGLRLVPCRMSVDDANALLVAVCKRLRAIRAVVRFPPLQGDGGLQSSRYDSEGGLFCTAPTDVPDVPLEDAVEWLGHRGLLRDFCFQTAGDASRLMAAILAPALRFGPWRQSTAPFPLILTEADQSQSGKGFASEMIAVLYGEHLANVSQQARGGVGSLDEKIQSELLKGRPFVCLDNLRGTLSSPVLESFMTARGTFPLRAFFREGETDSRAHLLFATSNGVQMTEDLANRSLVVRLKKQPESYQWHHWSDGGATGDLLQHVAVHRSRYLGAVYAVLRLWLKMGMPSSKTAHAFRDVVGALNWMVTRGFGWPDLMEGHKAIQERQSNPVLGFLREFAQAAGAGEYYASDFVEKAQEHGLALPEAVQKRQDPDGPRQAMGRLLAGVFKERNGINLDGWTIERVQLARLDGGGGFQKAYRFSRTDPQA